MKEAVTPITPLLKVNAPTKQPRSNRVWRTAVSALLLTSLVACETTPSRSPDSATVAASQQSTGLTGANAMYNTRNYTGAVREFDSIITDSGASANSRRLAHLGKALIYLGTDKNWHSIENAKMALNSAGQVVPDSNEEFPIETDMFMDSITSLIGSESDYVELKRRSGNSGAEIERLKKERDALTMERDQLLKEQKSLNEALEKLKNLTLGN